MRHVYKSDEIPHLWMHQTQADARSSDGKLYFEGATIYSYGSHFPIARHVVNSAGEKAILFTSRSHSVTTSRHIGMVRYAIHGNRVPIHGNRVPVLVVYEPTSSVKETIARFDKDILNAQHDCFGPSGKFRATKWEALKTLTAKANALCGVFPRAQALDGPCETDIKESIARANAATARVEARKRKANEKARAERIAKAQEAMERWKAGEDVLPKANGHGLRHPMRWVHDYRAYSENELNRLLQKSNSFLKTLEANNGEGRQR